LHDPLGPAIKPHVVGGYKIHRPGMGGHSRPALGGRDIKKFVCGILLYYGFRKNAIVKAINFKNCVHFAIL